MENHFNCIYCYTNKVNGKKYVGQTVDFLKRYKEHINDSYNMNKKCGYNLPFHCAIRKYGIENFEIEILKENLKDYEEMDYWERYYIAEFDLLVKNGKGYNLSDGGGNGNNFAGKTEEEIKEIRRKISEAMKGENNPMYGRTSEKSPMYGKNPLAGKLDEELAEISRKLSEARREVWKNKSDEELAEISRKQSEANKDEKNPRARKVVSVDPITKQPIFTWQYKKQATKFYGIKHTTLDYYLKGKAKTGHEYNGFLWYYLDEYEQLTN